MDDDEFWALIQSMMRLERGKGEAPTNYSEVLAAWADLWRRHVRGNFTLAERHEARQQGFHIYLDRAYPRIAAAHTAKSVQSFGGRRKVDAGPGAFLKLGNVVGTFSDTGAAAAGPSSGGAASAAAAAHDPTATVPPAGKRAKLLDDDAGAPGGAANALPPPELQMFQPGRMAARVPTVSFGLALNPFGCPKPVIRKTTGVQTIDRARVRHWARINRKNATPQNSVMKCSAKDAAIMAQVQTDLLNGEPKQWEWLHLCSFKMGGIFGNPQVPGNLVAGTYDCNTAMITLEDAIKRLAERDNMVFEVCVSATMYPGTHLAMMINYEVTCNGRTTLTHFYPMSTDQVMRGEIRVAVDVLRRFFNGEDVPGAATAGAAATAVAAAALGGSPGGADSSKRKRE